MVRRGYAWLLGALVLSFLWPACGGKVALTRAEPQVHACQDSADCPSGQQCRENMCVGQGCEPGCQPGERSCHNDVVVACFYDSNDCPKFYPQWRCDSDEVCRDGVCVPPGCQALCQVGERSCQGNDVMVCRSDDAGCPALVMEKTCASDEHCQDGTCVSNEHCDDVCALGDTVCSDDGVPASCQPSETGCLALVPQAACLEHQVCKEGQCQCAETCQAGQTRCGQGGGIQECLGPDGGGCTYWGAEQPCGEHQACVDGACQCQGGCNPGSTQCGPNDGVQTCQTDADGCNFMGPEQECYADMSCVASEGKCMPHTDPSCFGVNECLYYGQKKCMDPNYYGNCKYGDDGCLHWDCST